MKARVKKPLRDLPQLIVTYLLFICSQFIGYNINSHINGTRWEMDSLRIGYKIRKWYFSYAKFQSHLWTPFWLTDKTAYIFLHEHEPSSWLCLPLVKISCRYACAYSLWFLCVLINTYHSIWLSNTTALLFIQSIWIIIPIIKRTKFNERKTLHLCKGRRKKIGSYLIRKNKCR